MNETALIYGIVLGATVFLALRWMPGSLRTRIGLKSGASCASKSACGSKGCDGCH